MIESLFRDSTVSWVRIVNGIDKYVTETSETISLENVEHGVTWKPVAKAKPRPKLTVTLSPFSIPVRERNWKDIKTERFRQERKTVSKAMTRFLRQYPSVPREDDGAVRFDEIMEKFKAKFDGTSQWPIDDWITCLAKGGGPKKRFQCCLNPNSSKHFLYFKAIQGHSGGNLVDPALQDNVLLPEDFTEYICHVGNASEIHSKASSGLIPGGRSLKRERQSVLFTVVNTMDDDQIMEEIRSDSDKPRIAPYKNTWRPHQKYSVLVQFEARSEERMQFYQARSHAVVLNDTLPAISIEKAVCMKTKEDLFHTVFQSPRFSCFKLKPNSQSGQQDQPDQEARKSSDHQSASERSYGETRSGNVDKRIPGIPHSTVQQQDTNRKETVKKLIQQFENHPNKESFLQDLNKTENINKFSEESK